ncbi:DUF3293 domain-containing protein [Cupriavidus necator]|uniref:DUF3293 domain-containing protein n=1 Tax=Cupriavidus necator (strain ATCC 17699 / DSM 428 / KCTC 22496 / NCIMB 10442 / H16 / Stanier 337) TaxID=381666 RepID=Q0KEY7_CUPNH|nr:MULTISPECIES: DUF3293 domain-containing protein [Cupriavidus]EON16013.1 hypothetical protein C265_30351 [Cupriavidus sp. GA3-3]KUE84903.1 hypothetical protein ASL20_31495 [Cupriavidus necator]QCB99391.1 DUF3293 domain-containing protein [Cupriavidus necator H16]QQB77792.1 DUF3293 domain-containing protein [Cupriavidus necator]WKA41220.1 DUF3293 domain-containing protein [Cupriavidus necator]
MASAIDDATLQAYRETHYRVLGDLPMVLRVDQPSAPLAALHRALGVAASAFITAANPFSLRCDDDTNAKRQQALAQDLARMGLRAIEAAGEHPRNGWPAEPSFLVPGLSLADARALGEKYEQNAVVWSGADAVPRLVLLR